MTLYVMCGLSRAGKTTYAKKLSEETGACLISLDDEMKSFNSFLHQELRVYEKIKKLLSEGKDVIYDSMALCPGERALVLRNCKVDGCRTVCIFIDTDYETISERGGIIPKEALIPPQDDESFDVIERVVRKKE